MPKEAVIWVTIGVYFAFMLVIGLISSRHTNSMGEFTVGGRNAGAWTSALSYGTAYFSAVMFIGYAGGTGWKYGLWGVLPGIGNAVFGSLLAWLVLARRTRSATRRMKIKSMPQFFDKRFVSSPMKLFATFVIFIFLLPYSASVYKGLTSVCAVLLKVDERMVISTVAHKPRCSFRPRFSSPVLAEMAARPACRPPTVSQRTTATMRAVTPTNMIMPWTKSAFRVAA